MSVGETDVKEKKKAKPEYQSLYPVDGGRHYSNTPDSLIMFLNTWLANVQGLFFKFPEA